MLVRFCIVNVDNFQARLLHRTCRMRRLSRRGSAHSMLHRPDRPGPVREGVSIVDAESMIALFDVPLAAAQRGRA